MENSGEFIKPKGTFAERFKRRIDHILHPASSASEEAFRSIIAVLPHGEMKKSMEMIMPKIRDLLKAQDRSLFIGSIIQRAMTTFTFGMFGAFGGGLTSPWTGIFGPIAGAATGAGIGFAIPTESQMERSRIKLAGAQQEIMLRTTGGREAAKVFDSKRVDQITQAILWGTGAKGGAGGILQEASN